MKIVLIGGKSGGHIIPCIALAEQLVESGHSVYFFCSHHELDRKILDREPYEVSFFKILNRKQGLIRCVLSLFFSFLRARKLMKLLDIDGIVATGGLVSLPLTLAGVILKKPSVVIELNVIPGRANKLLSYFVNKVCLGFSETQHRWSKLRYIQNKIEYTGIPVRKRFFDVTEHCQKNIYQTMNFKEELPLIVVIGGSQGAQMLNDIVPQLVGQLPQTQWIHIAGHNHYQSVLESYGKEDLCRVRVQPFCENIEEVMLASHLIISRSGANVVAEIRFLQKKALFVPLKTAKDNHQFFNAYRCQEEGWAVCIQESETLLQDIVSYIKQEFP